MHCLGSGLKAAGRNSSSRCSQQQPPPASYLAFDCSCPCLTLEIINRYDAGDMTRFTFPAAFTIANLALAYLEFPDAFNSNGHSDSLLSSLRWAADWLLAARYAPDAFVAMTWAPGKTVKESHLWWGKPDEVKQAAEVRILKAPKAGADLLGQGAAALAAVSVVFKERDPRYSAKLLEVARGLYNQVGVPERSGGASVWLLVQLHSAHVLSILMQHVCKPDGLMPDAASD